MIMKFIMNDGSIFIRTIAAFDYDSDTPDTFEFTLTNGSAMSWNEGKVFIYSADLVIFSLDLATKGPAL